MKRRRKNRTQNHTTCLEEEEKHVGICIFLVITVMYRKMLGLYADDQVLLKYSTLQ